MTAPGCVGSRACLAESPARGRSVAPSQTYFARLASQSRFWPLPPTVVS